MVALQLEYLSLGPGQRVLEVGVGSGYLAALIAELTSPAGQVFGVDIEPGLVRGARQALEGTEWESRIHLATADGRLGWPEHAPFDRISISCATPEILPAWRRQLSADGIVVAPVGPASGQELVRFVNSTRGGTFERGPACRFVPLRGRLPSDI